MGGTVARPLASRSVKPRDPVPVSASARVLARLRRSPDTPPGGGLRVLHRSPLAAYVDLDGWALGLVDPAASRPPNALVLGPGVLPTLLLDDVRVHAGRLLLDERPVAPGRLHDTTVPRIAPTRPLPGPAPDVAALVGRGGGLTPEGDDLLCGWLAAHRATATPTPRTDAAVRALLHRTTLLSATLLEAALLGEVLPELAAWLLARGGPDEAARARDLAAVGHTSGAALLRGARCALDGLPLDLPPTHDRAATRPTAAPGAAA